MYALLFLVSAIVVQCQKATVPTRYGFVLFPGFAELDIFGPSEALGILALSTYMDISLIAETLEPVPSGKMSWFTDPSNATWGASVAPTHTFKTAPELDVLIIPGGIGTRAPSPLLNSTIAFVKDRYHCLQYLISICTGAGIAARAGVLDGKYATTNKRAWAETIALGPKVKWVAVARWVVDGNIWTSSGISAGIDLTIAFLEAVYGNATATAIANTMEYERHTNSTDDPFAALYGLTDANNSINPDFTPRCLVSGGKR